MCTIKLGVGPSSISNIPENKEVEKFEPRGSLENELKTIKSNEPIIFQLPW